MKNKPLILFVGCCLIPLALAYLALKFDWIPGASSNKGEFLTDEVKIKDWESNEHKQWTIALNHPSGCQQACEEQLATLENLYIALGKHKSKVDLVVLGKSSQQALPWQQLSSVDELMPASLYLIDRRGLVVLHYPYNAQPQQNRLMQKGLLNDLKKLLNYARSS